jgi:orotidine-5'-phosphate decarboxylase
MTELLVKYKKGRDEKNSVLCIGLDPSPEEVKEEDILNYCVDIVEKTSDYAAAYKPNSQFLLFPLTVKDLRLLNKRIRLAGCISILDHKLSDIGSTNEVAIHYIKEAGFDALTVSPFPGNIAETVAYAHRKEIGVFVLTLMSNSQAVLIQKEALINGQPLYQRIASEVGISGADGLVIGTTGHVTGEDIRITRELAGSNALFLCPGIGAQGGDLEKIMKNAGKNVLINVGRTIIGDASPKKKAEEYRDMINRYR